MTSAYPPAIADCAVTAAAMRAAAGIIEESSLAGLSVTCTSHQITVQVCGDAGDAAGRAAQVGLLATIADTQAYRDDSRVAAYSQIKASGQVRGIPVSIFTPVEVRTRPGSAGPVPDGKLPHGWRWVTDLDPEPATAPGPEAVA